MIEVYKHPNGGKIFLAGKNFTCPHNKTAIKTHTAIFVAAENPPSDSKNSIYFPFENRFGARSDEIMQMAWKAWRCAQTAAKDVDLYKNVVIVGDEGKDRPALVAAIAMKYLSPAKDVGDIIQEIRSHCPGALSNILFIRMLRMNFLYKKFDLDVLWKEKALERINESYYETYNEELPQLS